MVERLPQRTRKHHVAQGWFAFEEQRENVIGDIELSGQIVDLRRRQPEPKRLVAIVGLDPEAMLVVIFWSQFPARDRLPGRTLVGLKPFSEEPDSLQIAGYPCHTQTQLMTEYVG